jgi:hypothetical protein
MGENVLDRPPASGNAGHRHVTGCQRRKCFVERSALETDLAQQFLLA